MIDFELCEDYGLIQRILTDPAAYRRMANDAAPERSEFTAGERRGMEYVLVRRDGGPIGLFLLIDRGPDAEVHFSFLPAAWGTTAAIGRAFVEWIWTQTSYKRLLGPVPAYNRLALRLAQRCGFERLGATHNAVQKHGRSYDLVRLEIRRPHVLSYQLNPR